MKYEYIATQASSKKDLDEIVRIARHIVEVKERGKSKPLLLYGKPGIGKTQVVEFVSELLDINQRKMAACEEDSIFKYTGMPIITEKGSEFTKPQLIQAMENGGVLYLDELDQLPKHLQKALSSLFDHNQSVNIIDENNEEKTFESKEDLAIIGAYNEPELGMNHAFEQSFLSRFSEIEFEETPKEVAKYVILRELFEGSEEEKQQYLNNILANFEGTLEDRAIIIKEKNEKKYVLGAKKTGENSYSNYGGDKIEIVDNDIVCPYKAYIPSEKIKETKKNSETPKTQEEFLDKLLDFYQEVEKTSKASGTAFKKNDISLFRNGLVALREYHAIIRDGFSEEEASQYATFRAIKDILKGSYANQPANGSTAKDKLINVAIEMGLLPSNVDKAKQDYS